MPSRTSKKPTFPLVARATEYARNVIAGKILACLWVRLACQRHFDDLKRKEFPYKFDKEKAERAARFFEKLPHTKGKWAAHNESLVLEPWQAFIVCSLFGWTQKKTGLRRFREGYIEVPRKNGKSLLAADVGLYMFTADGEFGAEVYSGATTEKQAWEIFRPARLIAARLDDFREHYGITVNASNLARLSDGSKFEPIIGSPGDGPSPSCALIDEYHEHDSDVLYDSMVTGMAAREQPLVLIVTTAGSNLAGPCYAKHLEVKKVLQGIVEDDRTFAIIYTIDEQEDGDAPPEDDWTHALALRKANPNFGVSAGEDYLLDRQRKAMQTARLQNTFKTKHLNVWVGAASAWMNMVRWKQQRERLSLEELAGRPCFLGVDLAAKIDVTSVIALFPPTPDDERWHVHGRHYLPEDRIEDGDSPNLSHYDAWAKQEYLTLTPGAVTDYEYLKGDIEELSAQVSIQAIGFDPAYAWEFAPSMLEKGFPMVEIRASVLNFSEPMKKIEALVKLKLLAHGNCPVLNWMASNVVAAEDRKDNIYPRKERAENKIDGIVALIMAMNRAMLTPTAWSYESGAIFGV